VHIDTVDRAGCNDGVDQFGVGRVGDVEDVHQAGIGVDHEQPLRDGVVRHDLGGTAVEDAAGVGADGDQ